MEESRGEGSDNICFEETTSIIVTLKPKLLTCCRYLNIISEGSSILEDSIMSYAIIFWGNQPYSDKIFKIQKRVIRIITSSSMRDSCRELFKKLEILPLYSQYIFSISISVIKNKHLFYTNNQIHIIHTRFKTNLHPPTANLTKFQKAVYYSAIKISNNLPHNIKGLANDILPFQNALKRFLLTNSFYNSKEYFNYRRRSIAI